MTTEGEFPGQEIERAAAGEITRAGKTLIGAVSGLFDRWTVIGNTEAKAKAAEIAKDIALEGELRREQKLIEARQKTELMELEHQYILQQRTLGRLQAEWLRDQKNIEAIAELGIKFANSDQDANNERPLDDDWLLRFFQYAATVDDKQLQIVMARVLADAAIANRPLTSRRAIDTIRFLDPISYQGLEFVSKQLTIFGEIPTDYFSSYRNNLQFESKTLLSLLLELGLIKTIKSKSYSLSLGQLTLNFTFAPRQTFEFDLVQFTQIGREIAALIFPVIRQRFPVNGKNISAMELWTIQKNFEINKLQVKALASALVQQSSDFWDISYDIFIRTSLSDAKTIYQGTRNSIENPFNIPNLDFNNISVDEHLIELAKAIVQEFRYFDEMQLPNLIPGPYHL